jgi:hypothetical protein
MNLEEIPKFLDMLGGRDRVYDWRTLPKGNQGSRRNIRGTLEDVADRLVAANRRGDGIFITVNETDGKGVSAQHIKAVRVLFADLDGSPLDPIQQCALVPHAVIETSPCKYHAYWRVADCPLGRFKPLQRAMAERFEGDKSVSDLPRIMRVPGFYHQKSEPFLSHILELNDAPSYSVSEIVEGLGLNLVSESRPVKGGYNPGKPPADITKPLGDGERTPVLTELCGRYIRMGLQDDEILIILRNWNARNLQPLPDEKLVSTLASIRRCDNRNRAANDPIVEEFNQAHAVVMMGGKTVVVREDPDQIVPMSVTSFKDFYSNRPPVEDVTAARYWLRHTERRTYRQVVFNPAGEAANDELNLWRGYAVNPEEGDCSLYLDHVRENIAAGNNEVYQYLLDWMADAVQNPRRLPGVALALRGRQGTGKGVFISQFGKIFGRHFKHVQTPDQLTGRFTQHLADALLIFADEVVWGGDKQREGVLKALITEERRFVEPKGINAYEVDNYARLMMATNNDWAVPAGGEERRFCVLDVGDNRMQDSDYFQAIVTQMDSGGREALLHLLLHRDIAHVNIRAFPRTAALFDQKELSLDSVSTWWLDCLHQGHIVGSNSGFVSENAVWPDWVRNPELYEAYRSATQNDRHSRNPARNSSQFSKALRKWAPVHPVRKRVDVGESCRQERQIPPYYHWLYFGKQCRTDVDTGLHEPSIPQLDEGEREAFEEELTQKSSPRQRGLAIPPLAECREAFEKAFGQSIHWED